jgi:elongation factor Ts
VKQLREQTGAGIMDCKRALQESEGDLSRASGILKQQGLAKAEKKAGRATMQGVVEPYIHAGGRIGSLVEVNCETDFVARTPDFRNLAHDVAMQVAATSPRYVSADDIPADEMASLEAEYGGKKQALQVASLLDQPFIKDPKSTISDLVRNQIATLGENIIIRRFSRFELGADQVEQESAE